MSEESNVPNNFGIDSAVAEAQDVLDIPNPGEEGSEELVAAPKPAEVKKVEALKKKLKLIVDGEEFEEEFDPNDDEYMKKQLQLARAGQKRMGEKAQLEKEVKAFIDDLRKNPRKALQSEMIGLNWKELVDEYVQEEIEKASKTPEQLELEEARAELKAAKEAQEEKETERKRSELERLEQSEAERYDNLFEQALSKGGLPKTAYTVKKLADYMHLALSEAQKYGREIDITPDELIPLIFEETQSDLKQLIDSMNDEDFEKFVSKERIAKLRKRDLDASKKLRVNKTAVKAPEGPKVEEKIPMKKFFGF